MQDKRFLKNLRWTLLLGIIMVICSVGVFIAHNHGLITRSNERSTSAHRCGKYEFKIAPEEGDLPGSSFELYCNGRRIYAEQGELYEVIQFDRRDSDYASSRADQAKVKGLTEGRDITGDGIPELVLVEHHYGTCCGPTYTILSLGEQITKLATIQDYPRGGEFKFQDLDGDGVYEAEGYDSTYTREEGMPTGINAVPIVLTFRDGAYRLAIGLMKKNPPRYEDFTARVAAERRALQKEGSFPHSAWDYMLTLTYSGNGDLAKTFADLVLLDDSRMGSGFLWYQFKTDLTESPHWSDLAAMNAWDVNLKEYADMECPY